MSKNKRPEDVSEIVVMISEPLKGYTPDHIREMLAQDNTDEALAVCMAAASNKSGWIAHDIDDPDNDEETKSRIIAAHDAWWDLEKELYAEIIRRLEEENQTQGTTHITSGIGLHYIVKPFMERNGFCDGSGWWIGK